MAFNRQQVAQLLRPVEDWRVVTGPHVKPHLSQQDVLAHLIRVFGFGNFDVEVLESSLLFEEPMTNSNNKPAWSVAYRALVRLTVRDEMGNVVAHYDGGSTGESEGQPSRAASHDLAFKSALSTATKRAAIHLGDQFGLSLYNKGQRAALVGGTMVNSNWADDQLADGPQQEEDGGLVADRQDAAAEEPQAPSALPPATKRATNGRQGTRRAAAKPSPEPDDGTTEGAKGTPEAIQEPVPEPNDTPMALDDAPPAESPHIAVPHGGGDAPESLDAQSGGIYDSQEKLDEAIRERVQAKREQRAPEGAAVPTAYEVAVAEEPDNYDRQIEAADTDAELRIIWDTMHSANAVTTELRFKLIERKALLEARDA